MSKAPNPLLPEVEAFLSSTGMSPSYFGKIAAGNSELVDRLRNGGDVYTETAIKIRAFMDARMKTILNGGCNIDGASPQVASETMVNPSQDCAQ